MTEEDEEFERIEKESGWRKRQVEEIKRINDAFDREYDNFKRNQVLEEVAEHFDKMNLGDTSASFAIFIRGLKR
jgi:hypothetical protein